MGNFYRCSRKSLQLTSKLIEQKLQQALNTKNTIFIKTVQKSLTITTQQILGRRENLIQSYHIKILKISSYQTFTSHAKKLESTAVHKWILQKLFLKNPRHWTFQTKLLIPLPNLVCLPFQPHLVPITLSKPLPPCKHFSCQHPRVCQWTVGKPLCMGS